MKRAKVSSVYRIEEYLYSAGCWRAYRAFPDKAEAARNVAEMVMKNGWSPRHLRIVLVETYEKVVS